MEPVPAPKIDRASRLGELTSGLLDLLADPNADGPTIDGKSAELTILLAQCHAYGMIASDGRADARERLREALERATQLSAVARQLVGGRLAAIDTQLQSVRSARNELSARAEGLGRSCDIAG